MRFGVLNREKLKHSNTSTEASVFADYARMDYFVICHTEISKWYANRYRKMLESGECTLSYTPNYKLDKQPIGGGHHTHPVKGF
ncbi:MAG: hypothetical protein WA667_27185 [Candidatus Nitrosopolaris sp.]